MINYSDYKVQDIKTFVEFFERLAGFGNKTAFVLNDRTLTYAEFVQDIKKAASYLGGNEGKFISLDIKDKYYFSCAYFAVVLTGNTVCLSMTGSASIPAAEITLTDVDMQNALDGSGICAFRKCAEIATVLSGSGTSSAFHAVALSEKNLLCDLVAGMQKYEFAAEGRYVSILPYSHAFGLVCDLFAPLYSCSAIRPAENAVEFMAMLPEFNPTALNVTPGIALALSKRLDMQKKSDVVGTKLKKILCGGAATSAEICMKMRGHGINVYGCYGLTECSPCVSVNRDMYYKDGSAGLKLNCNSLEISGEGEIIVTGGNVMLGYLNPDGTYKASDGVHRTGDLGFIDEDGFLYVLGRCDDLLVFPDGNKLLPQSVENRILKLEGVLDAVVYKQGDKPCATLCVSRGCDRNEVEAKIKGASFDGFRINDIVFTEEPLMRNAMGKLMRKNYGQ